MFCELQSSVHQVPILEKSCHVTEVQCVREAYTVSPTSDVYFPQDRDIDHDNEDCDFHMVCISSIRHMSHVYFKQDCDNDPEDNHANHNTFFEGLAAPFRT